MRLALKVTALYVSVTALICAFFLSQASPSEPARSPMAVIHAPLPGNPVPYKYLDFSRALHYDYDIMMTNIESITPKQAALENIAKNVKKDLDALEKKSAPPSEPGSPGKLILLVLAALGASVGILTYANRRKVTLT